MVEETFIPTIGGAFVAAMLLETLLYFAAPSVYARAALVPLGWPRRIALGRSALDLLAAPAQPPAGYRHSAARRLDLRRLPVPPSLETSTVVIEFHPQRGFATGRLRYGSWSRVLGLVRVDLTEADAAIDLRARFVVFGWPSLLLGAPVASVVVLTSGAQATAATLASGAVFVLLNAGLGWALARGRLVDAVALIEGQLEQAITQA